MSKEKNSKRKAKEGLAATSELGSVLRHVNNNINWKNATGWNQYAQKTTTKASTRTPLMTEEELENLFNPKEINNGKFAFSRHNTDAHRVQNYDHRLECITPAKEIKRDYIRGIKFLQMEEEFDRLLSGLPDFDEERIDSLFNCSQRSDTEEEGRLSRDLTQEFKKEYMVGKVVGEGAYATVRVAIYKRENKKVAIKVYSKNKIKDTSRKKSVRREIRILQLLSHPNIVKIYNVVETNNHLNIVMEYLDGISLDVYLKSLPGHRTPEKHAKKIFRQLTEALKYMHDKSISHRDLKLENVILDSNISPKLIDFGFSTCIEPTKKVSSHLTQVKIFCGTPSYMAPEIVQKKEYRGEPADIWALGVVIFVSLTGVFPFKGATDQDLFRRINTADYPRVELHNLREAGDLVDRMLRINPEERLTAQEVLQHPWFRYQSSLPSQRGHGTHSNECRRRVTTSTQKETNWMNETTLGNKLVETCKENLKLELRLARQNSANSKNMTCTHRQIEKELSKVKDEREKLERSEKFAKGHFNRLDKTEKHKLNLHGKLKKEPTQKPFGQLKIIDLLKFNPRKKIEERSRGKAKRA